MPSEAGNERKIALRVLEILQPLNLIPIRLQRLETAVSEAALNAIEHGNRFQKEVPVNVQVWKRKSELKIQIQDHGRGPKHEVPEEPDIQAKLAGRQSPRGWGLFLMQNMVDRVASYNNDSGHIVELVVGLDE
jgi:anti-sigma regulatory factor (Ser/Thr protein kinase)